MLNELDLGAQPIFGCGRGYWHATVAMLAPSMDLLGSVRNAKWLHEMLEFRIHMRHNGAAIRSIAGAAEEVRLGILRIASLLQFSNCTGSRLMFQNSKGKALLSLNSRLQKAWSYG